MNRTTVAILFFLTFIFACFVNALFAVTPVKIVDGKAVHAVAKIDNVYAYSQAEKDSLIASMTFATATAPSVTNYTPTEFEVRISTTFDFKSNTSYQDALTMTNQEVSDADEELRRVNKTKNLKKDDKD